MGSVGTSSTTGTSSANAVTPQSNIQSKIAPSVLQAQSANNSTFPDTDTQDFHRLSGGRQYYQNQTFNIDTSIALRDYLSAQPLAGSLYSTSQVLNHAMNTGQKLDAQQQFIVDSMLDGMHNLGENLNLQHYGRVGYLDSFGKLAGVNINGNNFSNMTESQLKKAFTGLEYTEDKFVSTSYNDFHNAPNGGKPFTDKAVKFNIKAPASAQGLMPGIGPGGNLGEMILAPGQRYRITDVRFTGKSGRSGASTYKQVEFDVEIY